MRRRLVQLLAVGLATALLLPLATVSCSGEPVVMVSGMDLLTGRVDTSVIDAMAALSGAEPRAEAVSAAWTHWWWWWAWAMLVLAAVALVLATVGGRLRRGLGLATSAAHAVLLASAPGRCQAG